MHDETMPSQSYEPPSIEERSPIAVPLIGAVSGTPSPSAAFHPSPSEAYEAPRIEARDPIGIPLIGGPATSGTLSAAFRP
jgi:hypothetical protein